MKFELGRTVITRTAVEVLTDYDINMALTRHANCDWGLCEDGQDNDMALIEQDRILSVYKSVSGVIFWVITEADRSVTTILLPEDY
jgi:hypothetical protein